MGKMSHQEKIMGATEDLFKDDEPVVYTSRKEKITEEIFDPNGILLRRIVTETEEEETRPFEPTPPAIAPWPHRIGDTVPLTPVTAGMSARSEGTLLFGSLT